MSRESYQRQLETLRDAVLEMSDAVCSRLERVLEAYETKDERLAEAVIDRDDEINRLYLDIDRQCIDLLALQQPVARDLRFVVASFKIITDLERIGDHAVNIAARTLYMVENDDELIY